MTSVARPSRSTMRARCVLIAILSLHAGLLYWAGEVNGPIATEMGHLVAGISHIESGSYDLMAVNPPLVRTIAAIPVVASGPRYNWSRYNPDPLVRAEHMVGRDFVRANGAHSLRLLARARHACIPFSLLGAVICYAWASELYGVGGGLLSATLWCTCPFVLGQGSLILPDVPAAAVGLAAAYAFRLPLTSPTMLNGIVAGATLGLGVLCKTTLLVLCPVFVMFWIASCVRIPVAQLGQRVTCAVLQFLSCLAVLNLGYAFTNAGVPLKDFRFHSIVLSGRPDWQTARTAGGNRFRGTVWEQIPVPLPAAFVRGLDKQKSDFEGKEYSFLAGRWKLGGWWYYYLVGLLCKLPIGTLLLFFTACVLTITPQALRRVTRDELLVLASMIAIVAFVSAHTGFSHHVRYVVPALGFAYVWIGKAAWLLTKGWFGRIAVCGCAVGAVCSSMAVFPISFSYANELIGGPERASEYFSESNVAWGQDLLRLKKWMDDNPDLGKPFLIDYGYFEPEILGISYQTVSFSQNLALANTMAGTVTTPQPGWYVINVCMLHNGGHRFDYLRHLKPLATIGFSYNVYYLSQYDVNHWRAALDLSPIAASPPASSQANAQ